MRARGWVTMMCGGIVALASADALAEEVDPQKRDEERAAAEARRAEERAKQKYRLDLGVGLDGVGVGAGAGPALGGLSSPYASAGFEVRMVGPAWFTLAATGGGSANGGYGQSSAWWSARAALGVRVEQPVFDFVDVGGFGHLTGSISADEYDAGAGGSGGSRSYSVGARAGLGLHFRATSFFGIRLDLQLLDAGYSRSLDNNDEGSSGAYALLTAAPRVGMTFSF